MNVLLKVIVICDRLYTWHKIIEYNNLSQIQIKVLFLNFFKLIFMKSHFQVVSLA